MKTKGMQHQIAALRAMNGREEFALLMEMGTGKTWVFMADAERAYAAGQIDAMLVVAPKGVHTNWTRRQIPEHMDTDILMAEYHSGAKSKKYLKSLDALFAPREEGAPPPLRVLSMSIDAIVTKQGFDFARKFLLATRAMLVLDESARIKNPGALRTKRALQLAPLAEMRRIGSGAPVTNAPMDIFSQFEFLRSGLLGTTSYRAFVAEYAELLPPEHGLMRHILRSTPAHQRRSLPQVIARDADGRPRWRNLDKLQALIAPHSFRVLKSECLDLPPKVYTTRSFQLDPAQRRTYDTLAETLRIELGPEPTPVAALAALSKLRQVTSGFVIVEGVPRLLPIASNPRAQLFMEVVEDVTGQFIVWAKFVEEIRQICDMLKASGLPFVEYHGAISAADRESAVDAFQSGAARAFVGQPQSGGIGLTLTAASTVIYYSNDYNLDTRIQSEDRAHRIGTRSNVLYIDLVAEDTKDEEIAIALQRKTETAAAVLGDGSRTVALAGREEG